jgi:hypothetical protein
MLTTDPVYGILNDVELTVGPDEAGCGFWRDDATRRYRKPLCLSACLVMGPTNGPDIPVRLNAGPETLQFLRDLVKSAEEAIAWAEDAMCDWCEEDVRLADGRYCAACEAESQSPNEHAEADNRERAREARAERGAA